MNRKTKRKAPTSVARQTIVRRLPRAHVLVADSGVARILREPGIAAGEQPLRGAELEEITLLENPSAHLPSRALVTDRTGRVFDSGSRSGHGPKTRTRHGAQSDYDPHAVELERFAKRVAKRLDAECGSGRLEALVVIAGPEGSL